MVCCKAPLSKKVTTMRSTTRQRVFCFEKPQYAHTRWIVSAYYSFIRLVQRIFNCDKCETTSLLNTLICRKFGPNTFMIRTNWGIVKCCQSLQFVLIRKTIVFIASQITCYVHRFSLKQRQAKCLPTSWVFLVWRFFLVEAGLEQLV